MSNKTLPTLRIYLMKDIKETAEVKLGDFIDEAKREDFTEQNPKNETAVGTFFLNSQHRSSPAWYKFFSDNFSLPDSNVGNSYSGIYFIKASNRFFAITFGSGSFAIDKQKVEFDFGIKVALNAIAERTIRSVDTVDFGFAAERSRRQPSRPVALHETSFSPTTDLIRVISGETKITALGRNVSGSAEVLVVKGGYEFNEIESLCSEALKLFNSDNYKSKFPFYDKLKIVKDLSLKDSLDASLFKALFDDEKSASIYMAPPKIDTEENVEGYKFGGLYHRELLPFISISKLLELIKLPNNKKKIKSMSWFKKNVVNTFYDDNKRRTWPIFSCFVFETNVNGAQYILTEGEWFNVDSSLHKTVTTLFDSCLQNQYLPDARYLIDESPTKIELERDYNERAAQDVPDFVLMDRKSIGTTNFGANFEFCDLLDYRLRKIIHVKRGNGSSLLSHLFMQGVQYSRLFLEDKKFRDDARAIVASEVDRSIANQILPPSPNPADYTICFGVIIRKGQRSGLSIPFMSKMTFQTAHQELSRRGFNVELHLVEAKDYSEKQGAEAA